jgi:hypothetical protein
VFAEAPAGGPAPSTTVIRQSHLSCISGSEGFTALTLTKPVYFDELAAEGITGSGGCAAATVVGVLRRRPTPRAQRAAPRGMPDS